MLIALVLIALFIASMLGIVVGYYNTLLGLDLLAVKWVFEAVPIIKASIVLTLSCPIYILLAFFTSKGKYEIYTSEIIALSIFTPMVLVLVLLPGELDKPDHLQLNIKSMFLILCASQYFASKLVQKEFWVIGGRDIEI